MGKFWLSKGEIIENHSIIMKTWQKREINFWSAIFVYTHSYQCNLDTQHCLISVSDFTSKVIMNTIIIATRNHYTWKLNKTKKYSKHSKKNLHNMKSIKNWKKGMIGIRQNPTLWLFWNVSSSIYCFLQHNLTYLLTQSF